MSFCVILTEIRHLLLDFIAFVREHANPQTARTCRKEMNKRGAHARFYNVRGKK